MQLVGYASGVNADISNQSRGPENLDACALRQPRAVPQSSDFSPLHLFSVLFPHLLPHHISVIQRLYSVDLSLSIVVAPALGAYRL